MEPNFVEPNLTLVKMTDARKGKVESEVAVFSAKRWDRRSSEALIESTAPCHDAQVVRPYRVSNPLHLTVLTTKLEDYTTAPQRLQFPAQLQFAF